VKYLFGTLVGAVIGMIVLFISAAAAFIGGLMLGWEIFGDKSETASPVGSVGGVQYRRASSTPTEEPQT
jgi:hypothetical protein